MRDLETKQPIEMSGVYREAGVAQLAEHQPSKLRVAGSIPVSRSMITPLFGSFSKIRLDQPVLLLTGFSFFFAHVAQSVEHFLGKEEVIGSIPIVGSRILNERQGGRSHVKAEV